MKKSARAAGQIIDPEEKDAGVGKWLYITSPDDLSSMESNLIRKSLIKISYFSKSKAYVDMLLSNSCKSLIDKPTRRTSSSATHIDYIISNNIISGAISGIGLSDISDHLAVFAIIPASHKCNKPNKRIIRDMRNFNQDHFLNDLCQQFNEN